MLSTIMCIDCWGHQESGGYSLFLQSLKPLIGPLFPSTANDLRLRPLVRIGSLSSVNSLGSISEQNNVNSRKEALKESSLAINEHPEPLFHLENNMNHLAVSEGEESSCTVT